MGSVLYFLFTMLAATVAIPVLVLFLEVVGGTIAVLRGSRSIQDEHAAAHNVVVLVPAHNESTGIRQTLKDVCEQLSQHDRILVVADNCTDDTAVIARQCGAEVVERDDPDHRGKGYALRYGIEYLRLQPPSTLIVIDADCRVVVGALRKLAILSEATRSPVQAYYSMRAPENSEVNLQVSEFAWRVKNWLRPMGLSFFGLPCQLVGSGMAFPWELLIEAPLPGGSLVEDLEWGAELSARGRYPLFCPSAEVSSVFPTYFEAAKTQRMRWEGGHLATIATVVPRALGRSLLRFDFRLLGQTLDLMVPPLAFLVFWVFATFFLCLGYRIVSGQDLPIEICVTAVVLFSSSIVAAWFACGRQSLPLRSVKLIIPYATSKLVMYVSMGTGKHRPRWVRTRRGDSAQSEE